MSTRLQWCLDFLKEFLKENMQKTGPFLTPVDVGLYTDYAEKVRRPIDFGTIKRQLEKKQYFSSEEFAADMRLVFSNCFRYNPNKDAIVDIAKQLRSDFELRYAKKLNSLAVITTEEQVLTERRRLVERAVSTSSRFDSVNSVQYGVARPSTASLARLSTASAVQTDAKSKRKQKDAIEALKRDIQELQKVVLSVGAHHGAVSTDAIASLPIPDVARLATKRSLDSSKDAERSRVSKRVRKNNECAPIVDDPTHSSAKSEEVSSTTHTPTKDVANVSSSSADADSMEIDDTAAVESAATLPPSPARSSPMSLRNAEADKPTALESRSPSETVVPALAVIEQKPAKVEVLATVSATSVMETNSPTSAIPLASSAASLTSTTIITSGDEAENNTNSQLSQPQQSPPKKTGALERVTANLYARKDHQTANTITTPVTAGGLSRLASVGGGLGALDWQKVDLGVASHMFQEKMEEAKQQHRKETEARAAARVAEQQRELAKAQPAVVARPTGKHLSPGWQTQLPAHQQLAADTYTPTNTGVVNVTMTPADMSPPFSDTSSAASSTAPVPTSTSERMRQRELERELERQKRRRMTERDFGVDPQQRAVNDFWKDMREEGLAYGSF